MSTTQRGTVLQVPSGDNPGLLFLNGRQVPFALANLWQSPVAPAVNQVVEVTLDETGNAIRIVMVDAQTLAKEKLGEFANLAGDHGQQVAVQGKAIFHKVRDRMGPVLMITCAVLFVAWIFLPALNVNFGYGNAKSFSLMDILGINLSQYGVNSGFGFWSFWGLVAVVLPWVAPWLRARWAPLLNAAPLLMLIVGYLHVSWQIHGMVSQATAAAGTAGGAGAQQMAQSMMDQMSAQISQAISFGFGFWIVLLLSLALAVIGLLRYNRQPHTSPTV